MLKNGLIVIVVAALWGGCIDAPSPQPAPEPSEATRPFGSPLEALARCSYGTCYEPTIAADTWGRVFVTDGEFLGISHDGGATFGLGSVPPIPTATHDLQLDALVQTAPDGRLFYSAILGTAAVYKPLGLPLVGTGIQIAWSDDGASTWEGNNLVDIASDALPVLGTDRQWVAFSPDGTIHLSYVARTGIWVGHSADGGATWDPWVRVFGKEEQIGHSGPLRWHDGSLLLPACGAGAVLVSRSDDGGRTFSRETIPQQGGCGWFPLVASTPEGLLLAFAVDVETPTERILTSSLTQEAGWMKPRTWVENTSASPWLASGPDNGLAWFERTTDGGAVPCFARFENRHDDPRCTALGPPIRGSNTGAAATDFAHFATLSDGRAIVTWTDPARHGVFVAAELAT